MFSTRGVCVRIFNSSPSPPVNSNNNVQSENSVPLKFQKEDIESKTNAQLKSLCIQSGISSKGNKHDLVTRLLSYNN